MFLKIKSFLYFPIFKNQSFLKNYKECTKKTIQWDSFFCTTIFFCVIILSNDKTKNNSALSEQNDNMLIVLPKEKYTVPCLELTFDNLRALFDN